MGCTLGAIRLPQAVRHVEIVEFLLEAVARTEDAHPDTPAASGLHSRAGGRERVRTPRQEVPHGARQNPGGEHDPQRDRGHHELPRALMASTTSSGRRIVRSAPMPQQRRCSRPTARKSTTLKARGGYRTADVIDVRPDTPNLDAMLAKFSREHWHDEDEVRFIIEGRGLFHIHPPNGPVFAIEVEAGDLIRVPRGTHHWFDLCADRRIRAIRLFQDASGWTPHYTDTGVDQGFQPVCFSGPSYVPATRRACERAAGASARCARFFSISKARRRRSRSSTTCCFRMRAGICGVTSSSTRARPTYASLFDQLRDEHARRSARRASPYRPGSMRLPAARLDLGVRYCRVADGSRSQVHRL